MWIRISKLLLTIKNIALVGVGIALCIALLRETKRLENEGNFTLAAELKKGYEYFGVDTCAACST